MSGKPKFFWSPPDGAAIVGVTTYMDIVVVATASGVYTIGLRHPESWEVRKISLAVERNEEIS